MNHMNSENLRFYDSSRATRIQHRNLPHWEQDGVCAFVTMRLADSLPEAVLSEHEAARKRWLAMRGWDEELPESFVLDQLSPLERQAFRRFASSRIHRSLDKGLGTCVLRNPDVRVMVEECLRFGNGSTYSLYAFVIMPNHLHLLLQPMPGQSMKALLSTMRKVSARHVNRHVGREGALWQSEPFDHLVRSRHWYDRYRTYIRLNPARARLPTDAYSWWQS